MSQPYENVIFYVQQDLEPEVFWGRLCKALAEHQLFSRPYGSGDKTAVSADSTLDVFRQRREDHGSTPMTAQEWEAFVKGKFLSCKKYVWVTDLFAENWEDQVGPGDLWIVKMPSQQSWAYHLQINCHFYRIRKYAAFWERVIALSKTLFISLSADFGVACFEDILPRYLTLFRTEKGLRFLPTLPGSREEQLDALRELFPHLLEEEHEDWFQPSDLWGGRYPWGGSSGYLPASFYLLNRERYEATKPYLPILPVEAIERFPNLRGYGVQRIEKLSNGGAFLFLGYPYDLEE